MRDQDELAVKTGKQQRDRDPARAPGRQTRVQTDVGQGTGGPGAGAAGKRTQVEAAMGGGGRDSGANAGFESVLADAHRHQTELQVAFKTGDRAKIKESSGSLEIALRLVHETIGAGGAEHGPGQMQGAISLVTEAEPLLARARGGADASAADTAAQGTRGPSQTLPFLETIQRSFGKHDVAGIAAHVGGPAADASHALGATAYAQGNAVAFAQAPDLHTVAHEAAHIIQQRGGVQYKGGVDGGGGDRHEKHADAVADAVVSGKSAESLLDSNSGGTPGIQRKADDAPPPTATSSAATAPSAGGEPTDRGGRPAKGAGATAKGIAGKGGGTPAVAGGKGGGAAGGGAAGAADFNAGGDLKGAPLKAQLTAANQAISGETSTAVPPAGVHGDPKKESEEDHGKKVSQYRDGIDGIADMIGNLDGFDELCSACGMLGDASKKGTALASVKASKPFHQLAQMWQGAKDGGQDAPAMMAAFEQEFARHGFWGSTQEAYQLVRDAAKAQAAEDSRAAAAKKKAQEAQAKKDAKAADGKDGGKANAGKPTAPGADGGAAGAGGASGVNAVVQPQAAAMPAFQQLKGVKDADFKHVMDAADHHAGLAQTVPTMGAQSTRTGQIWDQLKRSGSGFEETFVDTLKMGVIAHAGDKLLAGGVEKLIGEKVPVVGPLLQLAVDRPWEGKYWSDTGDGFAAGWKSAKSAFNFDAFKGRSGLDFVGVLCAKLADLFTMFNQWLSVINKLVSTLSAVCLILGAVLIGVGIALCWLGVGEALMVAGGWLVEAGEVLSDIALALIPITLALSAIALVFRTAAAFLVPADVYAEQLAQEGEAAETFGKAAGTKVGLDTARVIETATPSKPKAAPADAASAPTDATAVGKADGAALEGKVQTGNDKLAETAAEAQAHAQKAETTKPAATPEAKPEGTPEPTTDHTAGEETANKQAGDTQAAAKKTHGEEGPAPEETAGKADEGGKKPGDEKASAGKRIVEFAKGVGRRVVESARQMGDIGRNIERLGSALGELGELARPGEMADRGLATRREGIETKAEAVEAQLEKLAEHAETTRTELEGLEAKLKADEGTMTPEAIAEMHAQIEEAQHAAEDAKAKADRAQGKLIRLQVALARAERGAANPEQPTKEEAEGSAQKDDRGGEDSPAAKRRAAEDEGHAKRTELGEAKAKQKSIEGQIRAAKTKLETAKAQKADADAAAEHAVEKLEADPANTADREASTKMADHEAALDHAHELDQKAGKIESAEQRRKNAEAQLGKVTGKRVEVGGEDVQITGVTAEGVTVKGASGERTVPAEQIKGDVPSNFQEQVGKLAKAKADLAALTDGESGGNAGSIAHDLHETANQIRQRETVGNNPKKVAQRTADKAGAKTYDDKVAEAQAPAKAADTAAERAQQELDKHEAELEANAEEQTHLDAEASKAEAEAARLRRAAQDHRSTEGWMENGATSGYKLVAWLAKITGLQDMLGRLWATVAGKEAPKAEPAVADGAKPEGAKPEGEPPEAEKLRAEALEIGAKQAKYEELLAMRPPGDLALLGQHREKASLAAVKYYNAHAQAYACYQAELAIDKVQKETGELAKDGTPIQKQAQSSRGPMEKSKADEQQRQATLSGAQPGDVQGADSRMGGMVMGLVSKIGDHSDQLSQKPSAGGASGDAMASGQDKAKEEAGARTQQGKGHSTGQTKFLDQAVTLSSKQDKAVGTNIQQLEQKQRQEVASRDAMRERKAAALAEEAAARAEAESEAAAFNEGYSRAAAWAAAYEAKRGGGGE